MKQISDLHFKYIILILALIIIALLTIKSAKTPDLINYLTFALTVTSIFLAFITIIYSFLTNTKSSETLEKISSTSTDLHEISLSIKSTNDSLSNKIGSIPTILKGVEEKTDNINELITKKFVHKADLESSSDQEIEEDKTQPESQNLSESTLFSFMKTTSYLGQLYLLACKYSYEKRKGFKQKDIFDFSKEDLQWAKDYLNGYCIALSGFELLEINVNEGVTTTEFINEIIKDNIENITYNTAKREEEKAEEEEMKKDEIEYLLYFERVQKFFEE